MLGTRWWQLRPSDTVTKTALGVCHSQRKAARGYSRGRWRGSCCSITVQLWSPVSRLKGAEALAGHLVTVECARLALGPWSSPALAARLLGILSCPLSFPQPPASAPNKHSDRKTRWKKRQESLKFLTGFNVETMQTWFWFYHFPRVNTGITGPERTWEKI